MKKLETEASYSRLCAISTQFLTTIEICNYQNSQNYLSPCKIMKTLTYIHSNLGKKYNFRQEIQQQF